MAPFWKLVASEEAIRFLRPPTGCGPVRMDRFSPYFNTPATFGLSNVRPIAAYRYLYPFAPESLARVAYYFDFDYEAQVDPTGYADQVVAQVMVWRRAPETGTLRALHRPDGALVLLDTRADAAQGAYALVGAKRVAYEYCDEDRTVADLTRHLRRSFPERTFAEAGIQRFLDALVARKLMITTGGRYLSLALFAAPERQSHDDGERSPQPSNGLSQLPLRDFLPLELKVSPV